MKVLSTKRNRYYERTPPEERFWNHVVKTDSCWMWTGGRTKSGYGKFNPTHHAGWEKAHRFSWMMNFGSIPSGRVVCHRCNMKLCVRPDHLYVATSRENTLDAMRDGLCPIGEKHGMAKLTESQVKEIRLMFESGDITKAKLSRTYGVSEMQITRIIKRQTWRHL